ncbi:MAG TPA: Rrf2 family transcriptional regulator [Bryobacteraceae bacterium]|nr:Rrf2 family transcriptional regulator [Bryobacteraceae bacterium]
MIYSRTAEHVISALIALGAAPKGERLRVKDIAEQQGIPPMFLAKLLQDLARKTDVIGSEKGPNGGFLLLRPAKDIPMILIVAAVDGGLRWPRHVPRRLREDVERYLAKTSIADLIAAQRRDQKRLSAQ